MKQSANSQMVVGKKDQWFETARVLNDDWVLVNLTTPQGEKVRYRIPQHGFLKMVEDPQEVKR